MFSIYTLIQSSKVFLASLRKRDTGVWMALAAPPITQTSFVSIYDRQLAIGGSDSNWRTTAAVHMYNSTNDSWEVINHMATPQRQCIAAVLPSNQLMVVGGQTGKGIDTGINSVELATIEYIIPIAVSYNCKVWVKISIIISCTIHVAISHFSWFINWTCSLHNNKKFNYAFAEVFISTTATQFIIVLQTLILWLSPLLHLLIARILCSFNINITHSYRTISSYCWEQLLGLSHY